MIFHLPSRLRRAAARTLAFAAALLCFACIGGTGTDTENGLGGQSSDWPFADKGTVARVVDSDGRALAGVRLLLHVPGFRPDSGGLAAPLVLDTSKPLISDSAGYARFDLVVAGKYVVEGRKDGQTLFFDTLAVSDVKALSAYTFRTGATLLVKGRVRLASGLKVDSGRVFIRGTSRVAALDTAGGYDLGILPVDIDGMAIGVAYQAGIRDTRLAEPKTMGMDPSKPAYSCQEADSAAGWMPERDWPVTTGSMKLDTSKVSAVGRSCDTLPAGTVVSVRMPPEGPAHSQEDSPITHLIAVEGGGSAVAPADWDEAPTVLVPFGECVAKPGSVQTTYAVELSADGAGLYISDVAEACLEP